MQSYDDTPKRRLFEFLKSQGMQENQQVVFLSGGGEDVRNLQFSLNSQAGHFACGTGGADASLRSEVLKALETIKWYLWHGNVLQALRHLQFVEMEGAAFENHEQTTRKPLKAVAEFGTYIQRNRGAIPNYGE